MRFVQLWMLLCVGLASSSAAFAKTPSPSAKDHPNMLSIDIKALSKYGLGSATPTTFGERPEQPKGEEAQTKAHASMLGLQPAAPGFAYPLDNMRPMRGFDDEKCGHQGVDIGGDSPIGGVGEKVYSIVKSRVYFIGTPESDPRRFGRRLRRSRKPQKRGGYLIPVEIDVPGYGTVYPMTARPGSAKTGVFLVTKALHPEIEGFKVRYMHLAAVRPDLKRGDILEAGEEVGIMGSTAVQVSAPHVHIDMENEKHVRVDVSQFIGLGKRFPAACRGRNKRYRAALRRRARKARAAKKRKK